MAKIFAENPNLSIGMHMTSGHLLRKLEATLDLSFCRCDHSHLREKIYRDGTAGGSANFFNRLMGLLKNRILKKQAKEKVSENRRIGGPH